MPSTADLAAEEAGRRNGQRRQGRPPRRRPRRWRRGLMLALLLLAGRIEEAPHLLIVGGCPAADQAGRDAGLHPEQRVRAGERDPPSAAVALAPGWVPPPP